MNNFLRIVLLGLLVPSAAFAQNYNFDDLNAGGEKSRSQEIKGIAGESEKALQRQNQEWQAEEEAKRRASEAAFERYQAERALGNGKRYYKCEFSCRTNGFVLYKGTDKFEFKVKADESWMAEKLVKPEADKICSDVGGSGEHMWETGLRCEELR